MSNSVNEQSGSPRDSRNSGNTTGMSVGSQVNVGPIKPVDHKAFEGTNVGDYRKKGADAVLPPQPPVRSASNGDPDKQLEGVGG